MRRSVLLQHLDPVPTLNSRPIEWEQLLLHPLACSQWRPKCQVPNSPLNQDSGRDELGDSLAKLMKGGVWFGLDCVLRDLALGAW